MYITYLVISGIMVTSSPYVCATGSTSAFKNHTCSSVVGVTNNTGESFTFSLTTKNSLIQLPTTSLNCTYVYKIIQLRTLKISLIYGNQSRLHSFSCSLFAHIEFRVSTVGKPVKTLKCTESGQWIIRWPWDTVVMEIHLSHLASSKHNDGGGFSVDVIVTKSNGYYKNRGPIWYKNQIRLPNVVNHPDFKVPVYCLDGSGVKITYDPSYGPSSLYRSVNKNKVRLQLTDKSVCIRTHSVSFWNLRSGECPWELNLVVSGGIAMVLQCHAVKQFWCLPESWLVHTDYLEVDFVSAVDKYTFGDYKIDMETNLSYIRCPITTTTTTTTTATIIYRTTEGQHYLSTMAQPVATVILPIVGVVMVVCCIICIACYKRRSAQSNRMNNIRFGVSENYDRNGAAGDDNASQNPAYRNRDPVRGPLSTRLTESNTDYSYTDPPPNYSGLMTTSLSSQTPDSPSLPPDYSGLAISSALPTAPPPSYEAALDMIDTPDAM